MKHYWMVVDDEYDAFDCTDCVAMVQYPYAVCPKCGTKMEGVLMMDDSLLTLDEYEKWSLGQMVSHRTANP